MFDPNRKPRPPSGVKQILQERQDYFDPKRIEGAADGFSLKDVEALGWNVDLFHASNEVRPGGGLLDSNEGRYSLLKSIYEFELKEHERARARAREIYLRS